PSAGARSGSGAGDCAPHHPRSGTRRDPPRASHESVMLGLTGGVLGIALAYLGVAALVKLIPVALPFWMKIDVNPAVLGFALAASVSTGILFGLAPALAAARTDLQPLLKEGARGSSSRGSRLRSALV